MSFVDARADLVFAAAVSQVTYLTCGLSVLFYLAFLLYLHLVKLGPSNIRG